MRPQPSPIQILIDLPAEQWDGLARAVRRAVDQLPFAQVPVALRPFSRWQPHVLRDTARARAAMAQALADDVRFRTEVAERVASAARRIATDTADPLTLRTEVGASQAIALLAASARWDDLATLAADVASQQAASGAAAAEGDTDGGAARTEEVRALRRQIAELERRDAELRRTVRRLTSERDDAVAEADRARDQHAALQQTRDRELAAQRARLARLRRRVTVAEQHAAASDVRRDEIVAALAALTERLQAPTGAGVAKGDEHPPAGIAAPPTRAGITASPTPAASVPSRIAPATAGRPSRLPPGIDPDSPAAVTSLLQIAGLRLLIDGYNVTKDARGVPSAGLPDQRTWLARLVSGLTGRFDIRPVLVFDGTAEVGTRPPQARGVIVRFTEDEPADELLVTLLDMAAADEPVLVVTSDREIRNAVGAAGANSVPAGAFLEAAMS